MTPAIPEVADCTADKECRNNRTGNRCTDDLSKAIVFGRGIHAGDAAGTINVLEPEIPSSSARLVLDVLDAGVVDGARCIVVSMNVAVGLGVRCWKRL